MDLTQFYGFTYWHYDSASVHSLRTKSRAGCLLLIIPLSDARVFPSRGLQAQFVKNVKDLQPPCCSLLHASCCLVSDDSSSPHSCYTAQGSRVLSWEPSNDKVQGVGYGAKEVEDYGNMQEIAKHTKCFQEAQQTGNIDSTPLC